MEAKFLARSTASIPDKKRFLIIGEVVEGQVKPGMKVGVPLNSSIHIEGSVCGVEFLNTADGCKLAIAFECESKDELELWAAMNIGGGEILVLRDE